MELIRELPRLRERLAGEGPVAFVPTMGNLHAGHIALVEIARRRGGCAVASIFVNRLQFEPGGDFERYPRTLEEDCARLERAGCDVVFAPDERTMYPQPQEIFVTPPKLADQLCGRFRPGHFQGVVTVVTKLFHLVRPDLAVFGKKDYQQLHVIRALVAQLNFGIEIVGAETVREPDGLAMSSRNAYLTPAERAEAIRLHRALAAIRAAVAPGARDFDALCAAARRDLESHGWKVDYVALRRQSDLAPAQPGERALVVLGAARLGATRLIDNLEIPAP